MRQIIIVIVLLLILGLIFGSYYMFGDYSNGTRAGVVQKLSHKGIFIKTWEGQLNLGGFNTDATSGGVAPTIWEFSIRGKNQDVLKDLENASLNGKRVKLYYKQKFVRLFWLGNTKYFVYKVEPFKNE